MQYSLLTNTCLNVKVIGLVLIIPTEELRTDIRFHTVMVIVGDIGHWSNVLTISSNVEEVMKVAVNDRNGKSMVLIVTWHINGKQTKQFELHSDRK